MAAFSHRNHPTAISFWSELTGTSPPEVSPSGPSFPSDGPEGSTAGTITSAYPLAFFRRAHPFTSISIGPARATLRVWSNWGPILASHSLIIRAIFESSGPIYENGLFTVATDGGGDDHPYPARLERSVVEMPSRSTGHLGATRRNRRSPVTSLPIRNDVAPTAGHTCDQGLPAKNDQACSPASDGSIANLALTPVRTKGKILGHLWPPQAPR